MPAMSSTWIEAEAATDTDASDRNTQRKQAQDTNRNSIRNTRRDDTAAHIEFERTEVQGYW